MSLTLYASAQNGRAQKILAAAAFAGLKIDLASGFEPGKTNKSEEYKQKLNPNGKVPTLLTPQGPIWESNAILRYVARLRPEAQLYGKTNMDNALVDQWLDFAASEIEPLAYVWLFPVLGITQFNPKAYNETKTTLQQALQALNDHLLHHTYLVGHHITIADLAVFSSLRILFQRVLSPELRQPYGNLVRWFQTIANQPQVKSVYGESTLADKEEQAAGQDKASAGKKEKGAAKAPSKKAEPKAAAPKVEETKDEAAAIEDQIAAEAKKKPKSKLDSLPPTTMDLDATKRAAFAIRPVNPNFFEESKETWDPKGWSWWTANYKYNEENKVFFMTGNLIGGFIQRCDAVRKYSMGVMTISGNPDEETPPFLVAGAFLFRGQEIPDEMLIDNPDSEYYEWKKVDISDPAHLQQIKDLYYAETLNGQPVLDRRFFK